MECKEPMLSLLAAVAEAGEGLGGPAQAWAPGQEGRRVALTHVYVVERRGRQPIR